MGVLFDNKCTIAVVVNLGAEGTPNANTISLFKDGLRVSEPHALPADWKGKVLYPAVTFKGMAVRANFGPEPITPLPFKCRMVQSAAAEDVVVKKDTIGKDGKCDIVF